MNKIFQTKPKNDDAYKILHINKNCEISIDDQVIFVDTNISDVIINIPNDDVNIYDGKFYIFKDESENASINNITINPNGLIVDKNNCFLINKDGDSKKIIYSKLKKKWYSLNV